MSLAITAAAPAHNRTWKRGICLLGVWLASHHLTLCWPQEWGHYSLYSFRLRMEPDLSIAYTSLAPLRVWDRAGYVADSESASRQPWPCAPPLGPPQISPPLEVYFPSLPPPAFPEHSFREGGSFHPSLTFLRMIDSGKFNSLLRKPHPTTGVWSDLLAATKHSQNCSPLLEFPKSGQLNLFHCRSFGVCCSFHPQNNSAKQKKLFSLYRGGNGLREVKLSVWCHTDS